MKHARSALALVALGGSFAAVAQTPTYGLHEKYIERIHNASSMAPLEWTLFGDKLSLFNGTVEFENVDISVPGNNSLPVELRRRFAIEDRGMASPIGLGYLGGFSDWDLDLPHLEGTFSAAEGWQVTGTSPYSRCSVTNPPRGFFQYAAHNYWHGYNFHLPNGGGQLLKQPDSKIPPVADGVSYPWITKDFWRFSCKSATKNAYPGEAFVALSPNGVKYHLDWVVTKSTSSVKAAYNSAPQPSALPRVKVYFLVSRIEDRYGNWVDYQYSGSRLTAITSNDGRQITLTYSGDNNIISATSSLGIWNYGYANGRLVSVTRPDGSRWSYSASGDTWVKPAPSLPADDVPNDCPPADDSSGSFAYGVTHPAGASASFAFSVRRHFRHNIPRMCVKESTDYEYLLYPNFSDVLTLASKTVTGPGIPAATWTYAYGNGHGLGFQDNCNLNPSLCWPTKTHVVTGPDGQVERYEYGILYGVNEGQLLKKELGPSSSSPLRSEAYTYLPESEVASQLFPDQVGVNPLFTSDSFSTERLRPLVRTSIIQEGTLFQQNVVSFDKFSRPTNVTKSSGPVP